MQRINLRVLSAIKIDAIVALNGLIEKRESQDQDEQRNDEKFPAQEIKIAGRGLNYCVTLITGLLLD